MAVRNVSTKNMQYVTIGGSTVHHEGEDLEYVNILVDAVGGGNFTTAPVSVGALMAALEVEGYIVDYTLPRPPEKPLTQVERVAKALMEYADADRYTVASFRDQEDYEDYLSHAKSLLDGDN